MRPLVPLVAAALAVAAPPAVLAAQTPATAARPTARLAWMAGCWEREANGRLVEEQWLAPRGGTLLGMSRTTRGDSLVEFESTRVYEDGGALVYAAAPSGQRPAEFRGAVPGDGARAVTFENAAHDFPQRILYWREGEALMARIEGTVNGKERREEWRFRR